MSISTWRCLKLTCTILKAIKTFPKSWNMLLKKNFSTDKPWLRRSASQDLTIWLEFFELCLMENILFQIQIHSKKKWSKLNELKEERQREKHLKRDLWQWRVLLVSEHQATCNKVKRLVCLDLSLVNHQLPAIVLMKKKELDWLTSLEPLQKIQSFKVLEDCSMKPTKSSILTVVQKLATSKEFLKMIESEFSKS